MVLVQPLHRAAILSHHNLGEIVLYRHLVALEFKKTKDSAAQPFCPGMQEAMC